MLAQFLAGIGAYLETAATFLKDKRPKFGRIKHLIAIPAFGVRFGGGKAYAGPIVKGILRQAYDAAKSMLRSSQRQRLYLFAF
jgi:hypothetical protein